MQASNQAVASTVAKTPGNWYVGGYLQEKGAIGSMWDWVIFLPRLRH